MNRKYVGMVQLALLLAIQIVLSITRLGFIYYGAVTITLMHIPVLVGTLVLGWKQGLFLGGVFGISSMITATVNATPDAIVFTPVLSHSWWSVFIAMVPRLLFPLIAFVIYKGLTKTGLPRIVASGVAAGIGSLVHTVTVLGSIYLLLGEMYALKMGVAQSALLGAFGVVMATNGIGEAVVAVLVCVALVAPLSRFVEE